MKQKTGRKLLSFLLTLAMVVGLMPGMSLTAYAASTTVTWNASDINPEDPRAESFTKDDITFAPGLADFERKYFDRGGTFTIASGKFTKIEVTADYVSISGTGWSGDLSKKTWTGDASSSVLYGGGIYDMGGVLKIVFTIETADAKTKETTPTTTFTATGADAGTLSGVTAGMKYSLDGTNWTDISSSTAINLTGLSAGTIKVVKKGNGTTTIDSDPQSITVTKAETPNLTVTQPTVVGGKGTVATTTSHEYSSDNGSTWTTCTANQEFEAGTYLIRVKASGTILASGNQTVTINAFEPSKETTPSATFTATGADAGTLSGVTAGMKYSLDGTNWTDISSSTAINLTGLSAGTIKVVKKGNGTTTIDSDPQSITVTKAETPNLTVTQPTVVGGKGTVATTTSHEYSSDNGSTWTTCTANQEFEAGTYLIRVKASGTILASGNQTVTINSIISVTVTFKVVNGSWNEGEGEAATADKTVTLTGHEGDTLKLAANQIPSVGTKPNDNYKAGSWDVTPSADTAITAATTYTYTYAAKEAAVVTKAPEAKTLTYTGSAQSLVTAGSTEGGTMQYALGTATEATQPYTTSIPTATDAGTYYVWYKAKGDLDHNDSAPDCVTVYITNSFYTVTSVENWEHTIDYPNDIIITVKRNAADNITYSMYTGASVDGNGIPAGGSSVAQGSLILTLKGSYLDTLSTGTHKVTISFKDGSADATISIVNAPPAPTAAPTHVPKTGDGANLGLWIGLILLGFLGIIAFTGLVGRKHRNR